MAGESYKYKAFGKITQRDRLVKGKKVQTFVADYYYVAAIYVNGQFFFNTRTTRRIPLTRLFML